jgi:GT2 family glycosyltransferase
MSGVAVVILNYNGKAFLAEFLPGVIAHSGDCEVIIADNCSTDDSVNFLQHNYPALRLIQIPNNRGFSAGYNYALAQIKTTYYILLNSDVAVTPKWTTPIIEMMEKDATIAAAQPKILAHHRKTHFEYAGGGGGYIDYLGYPFCRGRIFETLEEDHGQYDDVKQVFWATGACLFIRASVYHELGGLDDDFFAHMEEIDLCWRINSAGHKVMYHGQSTVYHVGGGTLPKSNPKKTYLNFRNGLSLLFKNYDTVDLWTKLPIRVVLDMVAALQFSLNGSIKNGWAVMRALIDFAGRIPSNWRKRKKVQLLRNKQANVTCYPKSIVYQHFILKKRTFREL